jgi:anti-sigma factor RsiW
MNCDMSRTNLDAYADESLPLEELAAMDDHLRVCPSCAAEALARIQLKRATRAAAAQYASSPQFQVRPEFRLQLKKSIHKDRKPLRRPAWMPWSAASAIALVLIAGSAILISRHVAREQAVAELLDLHVATLASPNPVDVVSTDKHTVKPWFQGKLPFTFNLPDLDNSPYKLVGGKLVYFKHNSGAQLLYELRKHQFSVFIVQDQSGAIPLKASVTSASERGFSVETWNEAGLRYVVISDTSPADVSALGELLRAAR